MAIDPASLSSKLVAATRAGLDKHSNTQKATVNNKIRAFKALDGKVGDLSTALKDLSKNSDLRATNTKLSSEGIIKASTTDGAIVGDYSIEVSQLAKASRIGLTFKDENVKIPNEGELIFTVGGKPWTLTLSDTKILPADANLMDLRNAINNAKDNPGVQAAIIRTGTDVKLVLSSSKTGTEHALKVEYVGGSKTLDEIVTPKTVTDPADPKKTIVTGQIELSKAQDAELTFNGIKIISQSNKVENITDNLTLELITKTETDKPLTLTVGRDDDAITKSLESLVSAYNSLVGRVKTATVSKVESGDTKKITRAALSGDSTASSMMRQLRAVFSNLPDGGYLSQVGLKFDKNGEISLDKTALAKSLDKDPDILNNMLLGKDSIVDRLSTTLEPYSKSRGLFDNRVSSLNSEIDRLQDKTAQLDVQMESLYQRYLKQFTAMQQLQSQMQQTSRLFGMSQQF
ncbi:flagellar filament capping protein FliD [Moritella viscosa]|uniref:Flagellar hook-associated protein 2 n=1 Tax=Moritella viscosa TaxID=80854 RepID=A0ABY1H7W1_9GAMM|nr:flagellar filament capping protein FliD [Moritella viscosa]CED58801.1 flagellar hook-associated protein 2 [Moritella viscosa]SGY83766.1 Flagellar distal capping protein-like protein LafB [Moritella viscosa]SGY85344.1 Flagellar distal capping protein-like protein LafB [Moritella viscosa]SHN97922.1 Flagellar distal capping protein-like protein LafB [Moritella viscosa]SHN97923.1 Flagellar distal capping protein-like protein LafB [Moritella viscosa]